MIARTGCGLIRYIEDSLSEVVTMPKRTIEPKPEGWLAADYGSIAGIAKLDENLVTIADFNSLIQIDRVLLDEIELDEQSRRQPHEPDNVDFY